MAHLRLLLINKSQPDYSSGTQIYMSVDVNFYIKH